MPYAIAAGVVFFIYFVVFSLDKYERCKLDAEYENYRLEWKKKYSNRKNNWY